MATAQQIGLHLGDIVRIARPIEEHLEIRRGDGSILKGTRSTGLDMSDGPLAIVQEITFLGITKVRYLESVDRYTPAGAEREMHRAYVGFTRLACHDEKVKLFAYERFADLCEEYRAKGVSGILTLVLD